MYGFSYFIDLYFFTATILNWQNLLDDDRMKEIIIKSLEYMSEKRTKIYGFVIMPNHIHMLLTLEDGQSQADFQRDFLKYTSQRFIQIMRNENNPKLNNYLSTQKDRKYQIWERRPYWTEVNKQEIFDTKLKYIHNNPLSGKWNLCNIPEEYKWSSCMFYEGMENNFPFLKDFYN